MKNQQRQLAIRSWAVFAFIIILLGGTALVYNLSESAATFPNEQTPQAGASPDPNDLYDSNIRRNGVDIAAPPEDEQSIVYKIVIDAGHGGHDPGASGVSGKDEKEFTLSISQIIYNLLAKEPHFEPYLTRSDDTFIELKERAFYANDLNADVFISIHGNTFTDPKVKGTETYYWTEQSQLLADTIHKHIVESTGFADRGVRKSDWIVLANSEVPAVLAEIGYMTNKAEEQTMLSKAGQERIAKAIVNAIKQYFSAEKVS